MCISFFELLFGSDQNGRRNYRDNDYEDRYLRYEDQTSKDLYYAGLDEDELAWMDEDDRMDEIEAAGLDPSDYEDDF